MCRLAWLLDRSSETVREDHKRSGGLAVDQRLEHHIEAALRLRRPVPGPVKRNEGTIFVGGRKLAALVDLHGVGRPMRRERRYWRLVLRTDADGLSPIATVFRGEDQLFLDIVVIAFRPAEIGALPKLHQLLARQVRVLLQCVKLGPVLPELVPAMLGCENPARGIKRDPLAVAETRDEAFRWREMLIQPVGVVAPGPGSGLQLRARVVARHIRHAILALA